MPRAIRRRQQGRDRLAKTQASGRSCKGSRGVQKDFMIYFLICLKRLFNNWHTTWLEGSKGSTNDSRKLISGSIRWMGGSINSKKRSMISPSPQRQASMMSTDNLMI